MRYSQLYENAATDVAVFYGGRFQPMHVAHYKVYMDLVNKFGSDNVFIATMLAKNADPHDNPFSFDEKRYIMTSMFNIPENKIINTQPYRPDIKQIGKSPENTALILVYSKKDAGRLSYSSNVKPYQDNIELAPSTEVAYVYVAEEKDDGRSATDFRNAMRVDINPQEKQKIFKEFFGNFSKEIYNFILDKLNDSTVK